MKAKGFTFKKGLEYVREKRPIANPNCGFRE